MKKYPGKNWIRRARRKLRDKRFKGQDWGDAIDRFLKYKKKRYRSPKAEAHV